MLHCCLAACAPATNRKVRGSRLASTADAASFCGSFGGYSACINLCTSLQSDACWNDYLGSLTADVRFADKLQSWVILQYALDVCASTMPAPGCTDWALLEPLTVPHRLDHLCAPQCSWAGLPLPATQWINATLPQPDVLVSKPTFCARRSDNAYCAVVSTMDADVCDLMRTGCADYYQEQLASQLGAASAAAHAAEESGCLSAHPTSEHAATSLVPPPVASYPIGRASRAAVWAAIGSALGADSGGNTSALGGGGGRRISLTRARVQRERAWPALPGLGADGGAHRVGPAARRRALLPWHARPRRSGHFVPAHRTEGRGRRRRDAVHRSRVVRAGRRARARRARARRDTDATWLRGPLPGRPWPRLLASRRRPRLHEPRDCQRGGDRDDARRCAPPDGHRLRAGRPLPAGPPSRDLADGRLARRLHHRGGAAAAAGGRRAPLQAAGDGQLHGCGSHRRERRDARAIHGASSLLQPRVPRDGRQVAPCLPAQRDA